MDVRERLPNYGLYLLLDPRLHASSHHLIRQVTTTVARGDPALTLDGQPHWPAGELLGVIRPMPAESCLRGWCGRWSPTTPGYGIRSDDGLTWMRDPASALALTLSSDPDRDGPRRCKRIGHLAPSSAEDLSLSTQARAFCTEHHLPPQPGLMAASSPDGDAWSCQHPILPQSAWCSGPDGHPWGGGEGWAHLLWAPEIKRYVCFIRTRMPAADADGSSRQVICRLDSPDFVNWSAPEICLPPTPNAGAQYDYLQLPAFRYGGIYLAFISVRERSTSTMRLELAWSADTRTWEVIDPGRHALPSGEAQPVVDRSRFALPDPLLVGDELWLYHSATAGGSENSTSGANRLHRTILPRDRFVALTPVNEREPGELVTVPLEVDGRSLQINADAAGGALRAEIRKADGSPLPGFELARCDALTGDAVKHTLTWGGRSDLSQQLGRKLQIAFELRQARLYAMSFLGGM